MDFENTKKQHTILVTGASSGIGKAAAKTFAAASNAFLAAVPYLKVTVEQQI